MMNVAAHIRPNRLAEKLAAIRAERIAAGLMRGDDDNEPARIEHDPLPRVVLRGERWLGAPKKKRAKPPAKVKAPPISEPSVEDRALLHTKSRQPNDDERAHIYRIIRETAKARDFEYEDLIPQFVARRSYVRPLVTARHEAIRKIKRHMPHLSTPTIGKIFKMDHSSILNALGMKKRRPGK